MKLPTQNVLSTDRVVLSIRQRFNPTKNITADALSNAHDEFDRGNLRNAALMWEVIEDRDDLVKAVAGKRKKNIARNGFEVVTFPKKGTDGYEQALKRKAVLEYFYDQIVVTHAIDANERGGFKLRRAAQSFPEFVSLYIGQTRASRAFKDSIVGGAPSKLPSSQFVHSHFSNSPRRPRTTRP